MLLCMRGRRAALINEVEIWSLLETTDPQHNVPLHSEM